MAAAERGSSRVGVAALIAVVVLLVGGLLAVRALEDDPEPTSTAVKLRDRDYEMGECLTWDQGDRGPVSDRAEAVPCDEEHLREVVGVLQLDDVRGDYPTDQEWVRLKDRCDPFVERYLGRYVSSVLHPVTQATVKPSAASWADGDRELVCELGLRQKDLAARERRVRMSFRGRVRDLDLVSPFEAGDCVTWTADAVGTVPCADVHQYEVTGIVDLHAPETAVTRAADVAQMAGRWCPQRLRTHLGREPEAGLLWTFIPVDQADLDGGVRGLVCMAQRFSDGSQVDLVGPLVP